jgi:alpha-galactosidase
MRFELTGAEITGEDGDGAALSGPGTATVGPYEIRVADGAGGSVAWWVTNRGEGPRVPRHVRLVWRVIDLVEPLRMFRHGYQSWSPCGLATFGVDRDPSSDQRCFRFLRDAYLGDPARVATEDELRSELVTLLRDGAGTVHLVGFLGGDRHDGTIRLRRADDGGCELVTEAFLGEAVMRAGEERTLHGFVFAEGDSGDHRGAPGALDAWATRVGEVSGARTRAPFQIGWCSWYHYFDQVTEEAFRTNLSGASDWPFAVFQLDDGYQAEIGDWLSTNEKFPSGLAPLAEAVSTAGFRPGLWLAPFLASPTSRVATEHPDWLVQLADGSGPMPSWFNPSWGGAMWGLDTTNAEVVAHLEALAAELVAMGFTYLKLDFTMAPGLAGAFSDPARTPAERVRAGYDAVRRGAGDDAFLLGCGAPIGPCIGVVDGMRIGADVAPSWFLDREPLAPSLPTIEPATAHACRNTIARSFQHGRFWLNDPDCVMLRTRETSLSPEAARTWAHVVGVSGGMVVVSDDLALLGPDEHALLAEVVAMGREADAAAMAGRPAAAVDLLDAEPPTTLRGETSSIVVDPATGTSTLGALT